MAETVERDAPSVPKAVKGRITGIAEGTVLVQGLEDLFLGEEVSLGEAGQIGEVLSVLAEGAVVACHDGLDGLCVGESATGTGTLVSVRLGPGLEGRKYDGLLRPLEVPKKGSITEFTSERCPVQMDNRWYFAPSVLVGDELSEGNILGEAKNGSTLRYRVLVPKGVSGVIAEMHSGERSPKDDLVKLKDGTAIAMTQMWPLRKPRPYAVKMPAGDRVLATPEGSVLCVGESLLLHSVCPEKRIEYVMGVMRDHVFDVVIIVSCAQSASTFLQLGDNVNMLGGESATSSDRVIWMPVLADAPWAQIQITPFSALVLAEFFRDMGYSTLVVMDDLSRWQQADHRLRRRASAAASGSGNVGAVLRRSGRIGCFGGLNRTGSVTILGFQSMPKEA